MHFQPSEPDAPQASYGPETGFGLFLHLGKKGRFWKYAFQVAVCPDYFSEDVLLVFHDVPSQKL